MEIVARRREERAVAGRRLAAVQKKRGEEKEKNVSFGVLVWFLFALGMYCSVRAKIVGFWEKLVKIWEWIFGRV